MLRTIQGWKTEFNKDIETVKRTQNEDKIEKHVAQLENWKERLTSRVTQTEDRMSSLGDKTEDLHHISKEDEHKKPKPKKRKGTHRNMIYH